MAVYNEILVGRFNRALQKAFAIKGPPAVPQLAGEISATVNIFWGVEMRYVEGWERFGISATTTGVAAQNSRQRFINPAGSNVIAVFEVLAGVNQTGADVLNLTNSILPNVNLGTVNNAAQLDGRTRPNSAIVSSNGASAAGLATARAIGARSQSAANIQLDFILFEDQEITLTPGMSLEISENNVNQGLIATAIWRERALEESERT
jgi:hypothetical protein